MRNKEGEKFPCDSYYYYHVKKNGKCVYHGNCGSAVRSEARYVGGVVCNHRGEED